MSKEVNKKES